MQLFEATGSLLFAIVTVLIGLGGIMLLLSFVFKNRLYLVLATVGVVSGIVLLVVNSQQTTFEDAFFDVPVEDVTINEATLFVSDVSDPIPERIMHLNIDDEETLQAIADDFIGLDIRQDGGNILASEEYRLTLRISESTEDGDMDHRDIQLVIDDTYINNYEVDTPFAHMRTIEALVNDESRDWQMADE
ncbi:hypothetical protein FLK61_24475 [Paenalkalicoccus suaedae]|uniref:Uncharacterized protein n=1 Tax=Paenalkalicoccus suaedae TaxID=2592382 RepID=A0A859F9W9_9BACI|nr:hypothetical protein [Paenalkalicoccus suaedae]QKS69939.1 hypothetical protein FLK61_24475 [Paenalkalicoccus suaedae]